MNKKFLILALLAISAVFSLGIAFASDDTTFSIHGLEFQIPDGYHITENHTTSIHLKNASGQECSVSVTPSSDKVKITGNEPIGGKTGFYRDANPNSPGEENCCFRYNESSYDITIFAPDKDTIEAIIG